MQANQLDLSQRTAAIVAGVSIVIMTIAAGFSFGIVLNGLIVPGDAGATAAQIMDNEALFRAGIFGWLIILICDVLAAWALYVVLRKVNPSLSLLTAWFRLIYTALLGVSIFSFVIVLLLISADYLKVFDADQLYALVLLFLGAFDGMWQIGLFVFGGHLLLLGYMVFISGYIPRILGVLLIVAAMGYLIDSGGNLLMPNYKTYLETINLIFTVPMIVGELGLGLWLLFKGGRDDDQDAVSDAV